MEGETKESSGKYNVVRMALSQSRNTDLPRRPNYHTLLFPVVVVVVLPLSDKDYGRASQRLHFCICPVRWRLVSQLMLSVAY